MLQPIVTQRWFDEHREEVVLADIRWYADGSSGPAAFERGHIPGATYVDIDRWLAAPPTPADGRHPLPTPETFAEGMRQAGVSDEDTVIAYDDSGGVVAARLVWMLRVTGHRAALLDGGLTAYRMPFARGKEPLPARGGFSPRPWPTDRLAGIEDVAAPGAGTVVLDARPGERFRGEVEPMDARPGHVPGAVSVPCRENLRADGTFVDDDTLRATFTSAGVTDHTAVVSMCGSGVTACHNLLVLEHLGFQDLRLYPGSWSQWAATGRPAATGR